MRVDATSTCSSLYPVETVVSRTIHGSVDLAQNTLATRLCRGSHGLGSRWAEAKDVSDCVGKIFDDFNKLTLIHRFDSALRLPSLHLEVVECFGCPLRLSA